MRQHHLLAPLRVAHAELFAEQAGHGAFAGAGIARPICQRGARGWRMQHGFAQGAQALVTADRVWQRHPERLGVGVLDLFEQQCRDGLLACGPRRRAAVRGRRGWKSRLPAVHGADQLSQQRTDPDHPAGGPAERDGAGTDIERPQLRRLDHSDRVQSVRRHPDRPRGRNHTGNRVWRRACHLHGAGLAVGELAPGMAVRLQMSVGRQAARAHPHRTLRRRRERVRVPEGGGLESREDRRHGGLADFR